MKEPNRAPSYAILYHALCSVARGHGYSLSIHGTMLTDLDLIAVPWVDNCSDAEVVKNGKVRKLTFSEKQSLRKSIFLFIFICSTLVYIVYHIQFVALGYNCNRRGNLNYHWLFRRQ